MIAFIELFATDKRFGFYTFIRAYEFLNETKKCGNFNILFLLTLSQICVM